MSDHSSSSAKFEQFGMLRKAIVQKQMGVLSFVSASGKRGIIQIVTGDIIDSKASIDDLSALLSEPVESCTWRESTMKNTEDYQEATHAISQAVSDIHWNTSALLALKLLFSKLPPVRIRMVPIHRYGYKDGISYLLLHHQSLRTENFTLLDFLNETSESKELERRIKVLVLGYCLGLITAIPQQQQEITKNKNSQVGIASRILRRIRGM